VSLTKDDPEVEGLSIPAHRAHPPPEGRSPSGSFSSSTLSSLERGRVALPPSPSGT